MATMDKKSWKYEGTAALTGGELLKWTAFGVCDIATAVTDKIVGTAAEACSAGDVVKQNITVHALINGRTLQMIASTAITAGAYVTVTTGGKIVTAAAKSATGNTTLSKQLGWANEAAAADLDVIEVVCEVTEVNV
jgi:hypothetical protein